MGVLGDFFLQTSKLPNVAKTFFKKFSFLRKITLRERQRKKPWWKKTKKRKHQYTKYLTHISTNLPEKKDSVSDLLGCFITTKFINIFRSFAKKDQKSFYQTSLEDVTNKVLCFYKPYIFKKRHLYRFGSFNGFSSVAYTRIRDCTKPGKSFLNSVFKKSHTLSQVNASEMCYTNHRQKFTNFYVYKTFKRAYHLHWLPYNYTRVLNFYSRFSYEDILDSGLFFESSKILFEFSVLYDEGVVSLSNYRDFVAFKYKRLFRKSKRYLRRSKKRERKKHLHFLFKFFTSRRSKRSSKLNLEQSFSANFFNHSSIVKFFEKSQRYPLNPLKQSNLVRLLSNQKTHCEDLNFHVESTLLFKKEFVNSNYAPVFLLPKSIKGEILYEEKIIESFFDHKYLQDIIISFVSYHANMKSLFILQSNVSRFGDDNVSTYVEYIYAILHYFVKLNWRFFKNFQLVEFIEVFSYSLLQKDLNYFMQFFKKLFEDMPFKKHKKILYSFEFILKKFLKKFFIFTEVLGFKFEISGKIGVAGNSKTRNKIIKFGKYSLTNKSLKIDYMRNVVRTNTGVMGFRMFLTY